MPLPTVPAPWTFYRLGPTNEKELFKRRRDTYDGVVVPAHIASYYVAFCAEFIGALGKPYFIDPVTYVFSQDPVKLKRFLKDKEGKTRRDSLNQKLKGDIKRSYLKLIEHEYGGVIKRVVDEKRRLRAADLRDGSVASELVEKVVSFQRKRLASLPEKYKKYAKYARQNQMTLADNPPMLVLPPYFYADSVGPGSWHRVNLDLAARTKSIVPDLPVFGVIFCSTQTIESSGTQIIKDFAQLGLDGFVLWVNDFNGSRAFQQLRVVRDFVRDLARLGRPIISMYGDAFSLVLSYAGLSGYCCGICYAERKAVDQDVDMEGGLPVRYYIKELKKKVQIETEARRIPLADYQLTCDCEICKRQVDPALLDDFETREHFMLARQEEIESIRAGQSAARFSQDLMSAHDRYKDEPLLGSPPNLSNWSKLLTE